MKITLAEMWMGAAIAAIFFTLYNLGEVFLGLAVRDMATGDAGLHVIIAMGMALMARGCYAMYRREKNREIHGGYCIHCGTSVPDEWSRGVRKSCPGCGKTWQE